MHSGAGCLVAVEAMNYDARLYSVLVSRVHISACCACTAWWLCLESEVEKASSITSFLRHGDCIDEPGRIMYSTGLTTRLKDRGAHSSATAPLINQPTEQQEGYLKY